MADAGPSASALQLLELTTLSLFYCCLSANKCMYITVVKRYLVLSRISGGVAPGQSKTPIQRRYKRLHAYRRHTLEVTDSELREIQVNSVMDRSSLCEAKLDTKATFPITLLDLINSGALPRSLSISPPQPTSRCTRHTCTKGLQSFAVAVQQRSSLHYLCRSISR